GALLVERVAVEELRVGLVRARLLRRSVRELQRRVGVVQVDRDPRLPVERDPDVALDLLELLVRRARRLPVAVLLVQLALPQERLRVAIVPAAPPGRLRPLRVALALGIVRRDLRRSIAVRRLV